MKHGVLANLKVARDENGDTIEKGLDYARVGSSLEPPDSRNDVSNIKTSPSRLAKGK